MRQAAARCCKSPRAFEKPWALNVSRFRESGATLRQNVHPIQEFVRTTVLEAPAYFFFMSGAKKGKIEPARPTGRIIRLGRQPYCELALDPYQDIPASGEHCQVIVEPQGGFTLRDAGSSWGTWKNEIRIAGPVPITTGDVITLGRDDQGRVGPQLKFYLARDILRCRVCEGPVYKRHFKCPGCEQKVCLRCVVVERRLCKACVLTVGVPSGVAGRAPGPTAPAPGPAAPVTASGWNATTPPQGTRRPPPHKQTAIMPGAHQPIPSSGANPSLPVQPSAGSAFGGRPPSTDGFSRAQVHGGGLGAGGSGAGGSGAGGSGAGQREPSSGARPPLPPSPPTKGDFKAFTLDAKDPSASEPELKVPDLGDIDAPGGPATPLGQPKDAGGTGFDIRRPAAIPCERCASPLNALDFFICERCNKRLCPGHRNSPSDGVCNQCQAPRPSGRIAPPPPMPSPMPGPAPGAVPATMRMQRPPQQSLVETLDDSGPTPNWSSPAQPPRPPSAPQVPRPPTQEFVETADDEDDDLARPAPGSAEQPGLSAMRFECPYCERAVPQHASMCSHCGKDL